MLIVNGAEVTIGLNNQLQNYGNIIIFGLLKVESLLYPINLIGTRWELLIKNTRVLTW
jgi:hypothetical protein